ncbi:MAG TPA: ATP-binding protein [Caulobacteraceae bacterium]|nr:ATP-binding protein [Caulobacteraceae bacterium]
MRAVFESKLRAIVETAVDGIILIDDAGIVTLFNPACERMFGYEAPEVLGQNVSMLMPGVFDQAQDDRGEGDPKRDLRKVMGAKREFLARRKTGDTFAIELTLGEAPFEAVSHFVAILRDISERRRANELRERLISELVESNEERAHFAHVASHDLRECLRMVSAFCGLLQQQYGDKLDEKGREYISLVVSGASQMQILLDDLVDYSRLGSEAERLTWFDAGKCLDQVCENLMEAIRSSDARVTRGRLPNLYGNPIRFIRLMQNLVGNAVKYVAPGVSPLVHVSVVREDELWRFCVRDNGIGIDAVHYKQIFEPFRRLHGKGHYSGTGLGLAICKKIVEGFGGEMAVQSGPEGGSTFSFTIAAYSNKECDESDDTDDDRTLRQTG